MTTAAALAVALPATGLVIAVVIAMWRATNGRMDEQGRRLNEHGNRLDDLGRRLDNLSGRLDNLSSRLDNLSSQMGEVLRALGRLEGRREAETPASA